MTKKGFSGTKRVLQVSEKITEKRLKWYGHMMRREEEHSEKSARYGNTKKANKREANNTVELCL